MSDAAASAGPAEGADVGDDLLGRDKEVEQLFTLLNRSDLVLVYGPTGCGKTSLVQIGLTRRYTDLEYLPITVRRGNDFVASLFAGLEAAFGEPFPKDMKIEDASERVFMRRLRPIFLICDHFEDLVAEGGEEERKRAFQAIEALLEAQHSVKIILSMAEAYVGQLAPLEEMQPPLRDSRLRIGPLDDDALKQIIRIKLKRLGIPAADESVIESIAARVRDPKGSVDFATVNLFIERLRANAARAGQGAVLTSSLVDRAEKVEDEVGAYVSAAIRAAQDELTAQFPDVPPDAVRRLLGALVSAEGSPLSVSRADLGEALPDLPEAVRDAAIADLLTSKVLREDKGLVELSHDSLARTVAEQRDAEARTLAYVRQIVEDRLQNRAGLSEPYLTAEELARIGPLKDKLDLTAGQRDLVARSERRQRRGRRLAWAAALAIILLQSGAILYGLQQRRAAVATLVNASNGLNQLTRTSYFLYRQVYADTPAAAKLIGQSAAITRDLVKARLGAGGGARSRFWPAFYAGERAFDSGQVDRAGQSYAEAGSIARSVLASGEDGKEWQLNLIMALGRQLEVRDRLRVRDGPNASRDPETAKMAEELEQRANALAVQDPGDPYAPLFSMIGKSQKAALLADSGDDAGAVDLNRQIDGQLAKDIARTSDPLLINAASGNLQDWANVLVKSATENRDRLNHGEQEKMLGEAETLIDRAIALHRPIANRYPAGLLGMNFGNLYLNRAYLAFARQVLLDGPEATRRRDCDEALRWYARQSSEGASETLKKNIADAKACYR